MTAEEIKVLGDSEMETGQRMAIALGIVSIAFLVILGGVTVAAAPNLIAVVLFLVVGLGSAAATGALFWAWRRRNAIITLFTNYHFPALTLPDDSTPAPALPEPKETEKTETEEQSRGGEGRMLHGFEPATLAWLCDCLANGMPWTEAQLEKMRIPHTFPPARFGKAEKDTPYTRLFNSERGLFVRAGIIIERGGDSNKPGKLAVKSPLAMMDMLKALPETDTQNA